MNLTEDRKNLLCHYYLHLIYSEIQTNYLCKSPPDYGEILPQGVDKILSKLVFQSDDIFMDFGSGKGKLVNQIFLQSPVREASGIELNEFLHQQAMSAAKQIKVDLPECFANQRILSFIHGNFLNFPNKNATIGFINSICFKPRLLESLGILLNELKSLRIILTLRPMVSLTSFRFKFSFKIECSWDSSLCYLYERNSS